MPDMIFENVNKRVYFRSEIGENNHISQTLVPQRLYVIHHNIEVTDNLDTENEYNSIDKPVQKAKMEKANNSGKCNVMIIRLLENS